MPDVGGIAGDRLRSFIERIERLEEEKRDLGKDIKEVYAEAKGTGFDTKIMRLLIKQRRMDKDDLDEQEALLDVYKRALGMLADLPLGEAAIERATAPLPAPARRDKRSFEDRVGDELEKALEGNPNVTLYRKGVRVTRRKAAADVEATAP